MTEGIWVAIIAALGNIGALGLGGWLFALRVERHRASLAVQGEIAKQRYQHLAEILEGYEHLRWRFNSAKSKAPDPVFLGELDRAMDDFLARLPRARFHLGTELFEALGIVVRGSLSAPHPSITAEQVQTARELVDHHRVQLEQGILPRPRKKTKKNQVLTRTSETGGGFSPG